MHDPAHVLLGVVNALMRGEIGLETTIGLIAVGHDMGGAFDILPCELVQRDLADIGNRVGTGLAVALDQSDYRRLLRAAPDSAVFVAFIAVLASDKAFINFNDAGQHLSQSRLVHRVADAVAHKPSAPIRDAQLTLKLLRGYALLGNAHLVDDVFPLAEGDVGVLEDRSNGNGELLAATGAFVAAALDAFDVEAEALHRPAEGTNPAQCPADGFDQVSCSFLIRQILRDISDLHW